MDSNQTRPDSLPSEATLRDLLVAAACFCLDTRSEHGPLGQLSRDQFLEGFEPRFGSINGERLNGRFYNAMIAEIADPNDAYKILSHTLGYDVIATRPEKPVFTMWHRDGQSDNQLPDGRRILIGGDHKGANLVDSCVYNDVLVIYPDASNQILFTHYGYPEDLFPPTTLHSTTLIGNDLYIIGTDQSRYWMADKTQVMRLDTETYKIHPVETSGDDPGCIIMHFSKAISDHEIIIIGGLVGTIADGHELYTESNGIYTLDINTGIWKKWEMDRETNEAQANAVEAVNTEGNEAVIDESRERGS